MEIPHFSKVNFLIISNLFDKGIKKNPKQKNYLLKNLIKLKYLYYIVNNDI